MSLIVRLLEAHCASVPVGWASRETGPHHRARGRKGEGKEDEHLYGDEWSGEAAAVAGQGQVPGRSSEEGDREREAQLQQGGVDEEVAVQAVRAAEDGGVWWRVEAGEQQLGTVDGRLPEPVLSVPGYSHCALPANRAVSAFIALFGNNY